MIRMLLVLAATTLVAGCAQTSEWAWLKGPTLGRTESPPTHFRFDWQIAGEPSLAPLQVFDDGHRIWLQYPSDQAAPAIFQRTPRGDRLLAPIRQGEFLVIEGLSDHLLMRGGHLSAEVRRQNPVVAPHGSVAAPLAPAAAVDGGALAQPVMAQALPVPAPWPVPPPAPNFPPPPPPPVPDAPVPPLQARLAFNTPVRANTAVTNSPALVSAPIPLQTPAAPPPAPVPLFQASPADVNIRKALVRWAREADWVFEPEHWAVDVDIPLAGSASFGDGFRSSVRELLAATELGERPLQPCFYANRVLRVVPLAQRCDRTAAPGMAS
ncbi:MAG TPA: TcpQ domain-containing protein [Castellaniella sp.]|nr:TcpQ domain-containing protein [Castellaniella sp.]